MVFPSLGARRMTAAPERLDITAPLSVPYCVPIFVRDEQVKLAIQRGLPRLQKPVDAEGKVIVRSEPVAIACFGPSLNDTWEKIREFPIVFSCSGSHKFLTERGIIPTYHVEVDPRAHKVTLLGTPNDETEYLIASACHPVVFDRLAGRKVRLWHMFATENDAYRLLPRGDWAVTGGSSVGLRCLTMARFLGFRDLHVFGMDGCEGPSGKHAAFHPMQQKKHSITTYKGVEYRTTATLLECAKQTFGELNNLPDVTATFYGDGLVQAMAQDYTRQGPSSRDIAIQKPLLITPEYADLNRRLHKENVAYGVGGGRHAPAVLAIAESLQTHSILDYGCGKGYLAKAIDFPIWEYDPAVPGKDEPPRPADLVVCTDVLEHIEPDLLDYVLDDIRRCTKKVAYLVIHTGLATKTLPDGRNTHLIREGEEWWRARLSRLFTVGRFVAHGPALHVTVTPKVFIPKAQPGEVRHA
jgi:uncharacterized Rossmann fold enzyme